MTTDTVVLDSLDHLAARMFNCHLVRKDLVRKCAQKYSVPTYVVESLLRRVCATIDEFDTAFALQIVEQQLEAQLMRLGREFMRRVRETGRITLIDRVKAKPNKLGNGYVAELSSLALSDVQILDTIVSEHARLLEDELYAAVTLDYDSNGGPEYYGRAFRVTRLRPIRTSASDVLDVLCRGRAGFSTTEWINFLIRSIGLEPASLNERAKHVALLRMVPFVEQNYNLVELGPHGTGKTYIFQQMSTYSRLISGGEVNVADVFFNKASGQRGLVGQYDLVCVDAISELSFDEQDGVNILKHYMASGEISCGKHRVRAYGSIAMIGSLDVDLTQQQRVSHLLTPLPMEIRDDIEFQDRVCAYIPGWVFPKLNPNVHLTDHFGLASDFLSECWSRLRSTSRVSTLQSHVFLGGELSDRDIDAFNKTAGGLLKLMFPDSSAAIPDADLKTIVRIALEARLRVKDQQKRCIKSELKHTQFTFTLGLDGDQQTVLIPELQSDSASD